MNPYHHIIEELELKIAETEALLSDESMRDLVAEELQNLRSQRDGLIAAAGQMIDHDDSPTPAEAGKKGNCSIEIRGGAGGDEAKLWAGEILRMYLRFCENHKLKTAMIDDLIVKISGSTNLNGAAVTPFEIFKYETGVHRVQRVPTTEAQGRIHTSTASVAVLPEIPPTAITIREEELDWQFMRAGGAGGQNVNKVNSAVRLTHIPSGIAVSARQEKHQEQNRKIALDLLRSQLWELEEEKRQRELGSVRSLIGRAQRAEKIRTYNFPQNRVTDHRTKISWFSLENIMEGSIETLLLDTKNAMESPDFDPTAEPIGSDDE